MGILYFTNGIQNMMAGAMRAHGYSILPTVITLTGICGLRLLWIYTVFARTHSLMLLYLSYPISWVVTGAILIICYLALRKKAYADNEHFFAGESIRS